MSDLVLIDDDPGQFVAQVRQAFPAPGHRIAVAGTGTEGVARVRATPPDLESLVGGGLGPDACDIYAEAHRQVDRLLLPRVLDHNERSQHKAGSLLRISRQACMKLREQGLLNSSPGWKRR
jgi:hypothetical protein